MIRYKPGVKVAGIRPEILAAYPVIEAAYGSKTAVITSACDGKHSRGSFHYLGLAIDLRTRHLEEGGAEQIVKLMVEWLTDEYDVVLESDHIHLEFQPKT